MGCLRPGYKRAQSARADEPGGDRSAPGTGQEGTQYEGAKPKSAARSRADGASKTWKTPATTHKYTLGSFGSSQEWSCLLYTSPSPRDS